ncbi:hypothetical protein HK099_002713 [Clydaea vesicula]|uniref:Chloride channel protein n=1 Tax=Clydaea vesicula TaxID=447962 RepID=A0AAD5U3Z7_9FUNG|nr:hypothetical protein HK099_002713 [Clydaea vesicula]
MGKKNVNLNCINKNQAINSGSESDQQVQEEIESSKNFETNSIRNKTDDTSILSPNYTVQEPFEEEPTERTNLISNSVLTKRKQKNHWLHRKSGFYDKMDIKNEQVDGNGQRVWYEDYTTIDWIHDLTKEKIRVRSLRKLKGWRRKVHNSFDAVQAWILVFLIGIAVGSLAAFLETSSNWLTDLRIGFCEKNIFFDKQFCCDIDNNATAIFNDCNEWVSWSTLLTRSLSKNSTSNTNIGTGFNQINFDISTLQFWIDYLFFIFIGCIFSFISASLVYIFSTRFNEDEDGNIHLNSVGDNVVSKLRTKNYHFHPAGSGIPELKTVLSGFVIRGFLGIKTLWVKTLGLIFSVSSGLMIGKQGPLIHISCCVGNIFSRIFQKYSKNEGKKREILSAASAAGVAVAFGAPIGGILFSLEEISYYFPLKTMWRSFFCALIATVTIKFINPLGTGKLVIFQVSYAKDWHIIETIPFIFLGLIGGIYGGLFIKSGTSISKFKKKFKILLENPILETFIVTLITGALSFFLIFTKISNSELIFILFSKCTTEDDFNGLLCRKMDVWNVVLLLVICLFIKFFLLFLTFRLKIPSGFFIPLMTIGACVGRIVGMIMLYITDEYPNHPWIEPYCLKEKDCINPGVYAIVGAASFLSGVTRMTVSLVVIMFELTGALSYALPIMTAIMVSKWVADYLSPDSIYENIETLDIGRRYTIDELEFKLKSLSAFGKSDSGFPVLEDDILAGYIAYSELEHALATSKESHLEQYPCFFQRLRTRQAKQLFKTMSRDSWIPNGIQSWESLSESEIDEEDAGYIASEPNDYSKWMDQNPLFVGVGTSMEFVVELFVKLGVKTLFVCFDGRFVGTVHKKKLLSYLKECEDKKNHIL